MTSTWDVVQEYLTAIGTLKDPDIFATSIRFISRLVVDIHDADHATGERISKAIWEERSMKDIRDMVRIRRIERRLQGGG